jgi:hypothetical protein
VGQEEHRRLHVRGLGEQPELAVDGERGAHEADRIEAAASQGGGAGPHGVVAGRCLEADAVRRTAGDDEDVAGLGSRAAAVAEHVAALDLVDVEHGRGHRERLAIAEPEVGADPRAHVEVGVGGAQRAELARREVADPQGAGGQLGCDHVVDEVHDLGEVGAGGQG